MKTTIPTILPFAITALAAPAPAVEKRGEEISKRATVPGFDISHYQATPYDFSSAKSSSAQFVIIKATQGTTYKDPSFSSHYNGATNAGLIRGGYHYADFTGDGSQEANYFLKNGGGWSNDGQTLPGMLDLEGDCPSNAVSWIKTFSNTYHSSTGRYPLLYSSPSWWQECTGNSNAFTSTNPLVMACYNSKPCTPQGSWPYYTIWQNNDSYKYGGDSDQFNGDSTQLKKLASG